jgi:osmoprotectant transport system permease protein
MTRTTVISLAVAVLAVADPTPTSAEQRPLRVASKSFTESVILGEIASQLAASAGARVEHRRSLGGTRLVWGALLRGEVDLYPDYTGTLVEEILGGARPPAAADPVAWLRQTLRDRGLGVIGPLGFNNT